MAHGHSLALRVLCLCIIHMNSTSLCRSLTTLRHDITLFRGNSLERRFQ